MAYLHLYRNPNPASAERYPYLLDIQSDAVGRLPTRIVAPVGRVTKLGFTPITRLMPRFEILGDECAVVTQELAAVEAAMLRDSVVNLVGLREEIVRAVDLLFTGI
ncbi:MAG: CcdB family protein [Myxococcota bacterium]